MLNVDIKPFVKKVRKMYTSEKFRNPDFASGWVYFEKSASIRDVSAQSSPSRLVYFFTKSANYNKLYVRAGRSFFLSPGMVLRHYSDPTMRHLKKKTKAWGYAAEAFEQITSAPWVVEMGDLFGKKEFLLKKIITRKIPVSWFLFKSMFSTFRRTTKPKRRIKRWIKKKYFCLGTHAS